tara:strand:- start:107 stop:565 length:459 start_codon:yes stop_codon:yes gene_type:complete
MGISTLVVIWDALFVLLRPASFPGGSLGFIWEFGYVLYMEVDRAYADQGNTYLHALATMSIVEALLVSWGLFAHRVNKNRDAHLLVLVAASLTCAKTMLFVLVEAWSGWHSIGHNEWVPLLFVWIIPNGLWIVVPGAVIVDTSRRLMNQLNS